MIHTKTRKRVEKVLVLQSDGVTLGDACKKTKIGVSQFYQALKRIKAETPVDAQTTAGNAPPASTATLQLKKRALVSVEVDAATVTGSPKSLARFLAYYKKGTMGQKRYGT